MNKNWGDRADKDLFFTILSVKAIGIISGTEWKTIGNHMRSMGYGFTNEGCRQHFQGLRRTQHKSAASAGLLPGGPPPAVDPTANPITRRPGPGRGRPRKNASDPAAQAGATPQGQPQVKQQQLPQFPPPMLPLQPQEQFQDEKPRTPHQDQPPTQVPHAPVPEPVMIPGQHEAPSTMSAPVTTHNAVPAPISVPVSLPTADQGPESLDLQSGSDEPDEPDEHVAKRRRLEEDQMHETLGDDPVLALTGHENTPDSYPSPTTFDYAEA